MVIYEGSIMRILSLALVLGLCGAAPAAAKPPSLPAAKAAASQWARADLLDSPYTSFSLADCHRGHDYVDCAVIEAIPNPGDPGGPVIEVEDSQPLGADAQEYIPIRIRRHGRRLCVSHLW